MGSFSFGFGGDNDGEEGETHAPPTKTSNGKVVYQVGIEEYRFDDLLSTLPEHLSYSTVRIESPIGRILHLPKRDLYDVKVQLLQEGSSNDDIIDQIDKTDIRTGVYEGGFKTWESAGDLASLLLDRGPRKDIDELVRCDQLGAGTALPTLVLFNHALQNNISLTFTLADYNATVLRLVTLPNLLLTWASNIPSSGMPQLQHDSLGDLDITPELLQQFKADLKANAIDLKFLSGPWSPALASLIPTSAPEMGTLILGAETIYSPASTTAFVDLVCTLLKRVKMSKAMVGAKRLYFGVGGSVDGLKQACRDHGAVAYEIENHGVPGLEHGKVGVGRALIEVQMY
ncbi:hypothetical protein LTR78_007347 [Recurvomyces mirabilis]|uniref:protein-histidine N-methyltransferase n=1 Tax=Recurvomyces mirabilis TaxID=574656 RepID=A0AAE0TS36_9PEZI|nr:hypothetical protein LTR78_007347 [Recurvomyces mirabilis]KAK5155066.1 hypothetical protein LTS14_006021 [Recurvomyces mirabilis]